MLAREQEVKMARVRAAMDRAPKDPEDMPFIPCARCPTRFSITQKRRKVSSV